MDLNFLYGVLGLSFWGYVLAGTVMVHITIMAVTLYLHRDQTHRSMDLHPAVQHFFRFWLWLTTGIETKEWVAIHRKHHARCETPDDPHSPKIVGLPKVVFEGAELYRAEAKNAETIEKYGRGTPDDWLERNVYSVRSWTGIITIVIIDLLLFGVPGIIIIAAQMIAIPLFAAGIINGVGHHTGYRNFECKDASTNIVPWGALLGGEELHNNHHAFPSSAKFSVRRWEFDIGWLYIRILHGLRLARIRRVPPKPLIRSDGKHMDLENVRAVIVSRMHVLRDYTRTVTLPVFRNELAAADQKVHGLLRKAKKLLIRQPALLDERARSRLSELLDHNQALRTVHEFRERLQKLWEGANVSNERLLAQFREWCAQAEESGIKVLQDFAQALKGYQLQPAPA